MPDSLVDWLRAQDDETLAALLRLRPDLGVPPPADLVVLATRAGIRASVHRACDDLDSLTLAVLEAAVVAGADTAPVPLDELRRLLGPDVPAEALDRALRALRERALLWGPDEGISLVPAAREVVPRHPGGLGRPATGPAGSSALPELLAAVTPEERRVLDALAAGPPIGRSRAGSDPDSPVGRLLARGLLLRVDPETVELPRQVGLALRGDRPMGAVPVAPPDIGARDRGADVVDRTAGGAALEVLRRLDLLIAFWGRTPPPVLRSGGLGVRELRRAAREMDTDETMAALLVELALAADLVGESDGVAPDWVPTTTADVWGAGGPEVRWSALARTWLDMARMPGLVGRKDDAGRPISALSDGVRRPLAPRDRRRVLAGLAELPPGTAPASAGALADLLAWRAPRRGGRLRDEVVDWVLAEATVLGVVALDALTAPGRALLDNPDRIVAALRATLPEPVGHVLLQADLTAVAPGPLETALARELDLVGEVESAGGATVYRFTEATVRRALDAGRSAADLHELFARRSATPVPQGLTYLVDDVARRHGQLRGGAAASFLRSDDEVLIAEVLAHPDSPPLELRRIAPTVLVSPLPLVELMDGLRAAGFSPAAEDTGGGVLDLTDRGRRTSPRRRAASRSGPPEPGADQLAALVARMRSGDATAGVRRGTAAPVTTNGSTLDLLRAAAAARRAVWIGFVDGHGVAGERVLEPQSIGGGVVEGRDAVDGAVHRVPLHRITSIAMVEDSV
ncbi:helicase-associated domain-containing protein [Pseudonocardia kunmingensis]|nr:helicase-associated domain-containing protein [Pseudonocardia kunmingensis]